MSRPTGSFTDWRRGPHPERRSRGKRLTSSTVNLTPTPLAKTFSYDPIGNMLSKSDVGTYLYPAPGSALPHAVMSVSGGSISATLGLTGCG